MRSGSRFGTTRSSMPAFANAPMVLQETLIFPYLSGAEFMRDFDCARTGEAAVRRHANVDDADPASSDADYFGTRLADPRRVTPAPPGGHRGAATTTTWASSRRGSFCSSISNDQAAAIRGATGWAGDRYEVVDSPRVRPALAWVTLWAVRWSARRSSATCCCRSITARYGAHHASGCQRTPVEISGHPAVIV